MVGSRHFSQLRLEHDVQHGVHHTALCAGLVVRVLALGSNQTAGFFERFKGVGSSVQKRFALFPGAFPQLTADCIAQPCDRNDKRGVALVPFVHVVHPLDLEIRSGEGFIYYVRYFRGNSFAKPTQNHRWLVERKHLGVVLVAVSACALESEQYRLATSFDYLLLHFRSGEVIPD